MTKATYIIYNSLSRIVKIHPIHRHPNDEEYLNYDGGQTPQWIVFPHEWRCPVCDRTKRELLRWGEHKGHWATVYGRFGFKAVLASHHDHGNRWEGRVFICGGCNASDAIVKRAFGMPEDFSFCVNEMKQFIGAMKNGPMVIDYEKAKSVIDAIDINTKIRGHDQALEIVHEQMNHKWREVRLGGHITSKDVYVHLCKTLALG